jgi:hypothetical protein
MVRLVTGGKRYGIVRARYPSDDSTRSLEMCSKYVQYSENLLTNSSVIMSSQ